jgi:RAB protein geranylgeranyltransferase component A
MEDDTIPQLEKFHYDWLVLGTGIEESMHAAHLAKIAKQKVIWYILSISC